MASFIFYFQRFKNMNTSHSGKALYKHVLKLDQHSGPNKTTAMG